MDSRSYSEEAYLQLGQDDLLVAALASVETTSGRVTFERLVVQCFNMFPKKFELEGYPEWPNASVVNKAWLRCRTDKKLISGSVAEGLRLTPKGIMVADKVLQRLKMPAQPGGVDTTITKKGSKQTATGRVVRHVEASKAYRLYSQSRSLDQVSEHDMCELLYGMYESDSETLQTNLAVIKGHVEQFGRQDLRAFLDLIERHFVKRLHGRTKRGGMLPSGRSTDGEDSS